MIEIKNVTKAFGKSTVALDAMDLTIPNGCVFGMVGANGAGKSTLLRLIAGVYTPDEGSVLIDGQEVYNNPTAKEHVAFSADVMRVVSGSATLKRMAEFYASVYKNFSFEKFEQLASVFSLKPNMRIYAMSKGMTKQAQTILALSCNTDIILFDETFDGLDPIARNVAKKLLYREVCDNGTTVVITSHSLRELEDVCDQLAMLYKGKIVLSSEVADLKTLLFKVQIAFAEEKEREDFSEFDVLSFTKNGKVVNMILRGERDAAEAQLNKMNPVFMELLPLSLDEVFTYEMDVMGYKFGDVN